MQAEFGMPLGAKWHHLSCSDYKRQTSLLHRVQGTFWGHLTTLPPSVWDAPKFSTGGSSLSRGNVSSQSLEEGKHKRVSRDENLLQLILQRCFLKVSALVCFSGPWQNSHSEDSIHASGAGIWGWKVKSVFGTVTERTADGHRDSEAPCQLQKVRGPEWTMQAGSLRCHLAPSHLILCITSGRRGN